MVKINGVYNGRKKCTLIHEEAIELKTDAPKDIGGDASAFSPTDLVAAALASCVLTTMAMWGERHNLDLTGTKVEVSKEMVTQPVRRIGRLPVTVTFPAGRVSREMRAAAERAAHNCPVHQSLHPEIQAPLEFVYE